MSIAVHFLGVGDASQIALGHASVCVEINNETVSDPDAHSVEVAGNFEKCAQNLLVDLGPNVLDAYLSAYSSLPDAVFITHCHLDHIADFERFFLRCWFGQHRPLVFVPVELIPLLHARVGNYPGALAEGGVNFWQAFQLIPVSGSFEFAGHSFEVKPARHHKINTAFSLYLPDYFYFTGDTRPIPEILENLPKNTEMVFHDCSVVGNPSHSGISDLLREYSASVISKIWVYHYHSNEDVAAFSKAGLRCVKKGERFIFQRKLPNTQRHEIPEDGV